MSQDNNKDKRKEFEISYSIYIKEFPTDIITLLREKNVKFEVWENKELKKEYYDPYEVVPLIEIDQDIYRKLNKLSEITRISVKDIASKELGDFFNSVGDYPENFLDRHLGIENIEDPIGMLHKMKDLINIPEKYLKSLKTKEDLIKEVENWYKPFKRPK